jgi:Rrf2 family protein
MTCALRLSEAAGMAMHAMALMALEHGRSLSAKSIASCFHVSEAHLSKVLLRLVKVGLLRSVRGPEGGFSLTRHPEDIKLIDVYSAIEGTPEAAGCAVAVPGCDGQSCILGRVMVDANRMLIDHLSRTSLDAIGKVFLDGRVDLPFQNDRASPPDR